MNPQRLLHNFFKSQQVIAPVKYMPTFGFPTTPSKLYDDIRKRQNGYQNDKQSFTIHGVLVFLLLEEEVVYLWVLSLLSQLRLAFQKLAGFEERRFDVIFIAGVESQVSIGVYLLLV